MNRTIISIIVGIITLLLVTATGWIANIVQVVHMANDPTITALFVVKCVAILVVPVGAVLGYVGMF